MTTKNLPIDRDGWTLSTDAEGQSLSWTRSRKHSQDHDALVFYAELDANTAVELDEWMAERVRVASYWLYESVTIDPEICQGIPVVKGSRYPVSYFVAELAEGYTVQQIAEDFDLDKEKLQKILETFSVHLDRSYVR